MSELCQVTGIINILSKKWSLWILKQLSVGGSKRFMDFVEEIKGINSSALSKRLKELEKAGLIKKQRFNEIPPRIEYSLTESGKELIKCFGPINKWASKQRIMKRTVS